jgi:hypothetical protein
LNAFSPSLDFGSDGGVRFGGTTKTTSLGFVGVIWIAWFWVNFASRLMGTSVKLGDIFVTLAKGFVG